jgi:hypothetical protein
MKYRDLVQFEPIESIIQIADSGKSAERLVRSYVISDGMAKQLKDILVPNLRFDKPGDNKGIFVVGNYGTGKSHLMSVIAAVAEQEKLLPSVRSDVVQEAFKPIAGRFKVIRQEIGGTTMPLRDIITGYLSEGLADMGVTFDFPAQAPKNKPDFVRMMNAFHEKHPDKGLLFVLDELFDYLKSRNHQALTQDLAFLREVGEICASTSFRIVAGVQAMLFGNPAFQFAAEQLSHINDRFVNVTIVRDDIAYVVEQRLLQKDEHEKQWIREYITKFDKMFPDIPRRTEEYVSLFPVHPEYLSVFERVLVTENRMALQTLSKAVAALLDEEVPMDRPGVIAYDSYWSVLSSNLALRADPQRRVVFDRVDRIGSKIDGSFPRAVYKPAAKRIVDALAVLRLTVGDLDSKVGANSEELRDDLMLYIAGLPQQDKDFLKTTVDTVLNDIRKTVGQFIMQNPDNGQWYIDVREGAVDYDAKVAEQADTLSDDDLDEAYYDLMAQALELSDTMYRPGFRIWQHQVEWAGHKAKRRGYVFLGDPGERSTTQPPLDYYLYFEHPYAHKRVTGEKKPDEIFFTFVGRSSEFDGKLKRFAAANDMATRSSGNDRSEYQRIAEGVGRELLTQLKRSFPKMFDVTYQGQKESLSAMPAGNIATVRELIDAVSSSRLSGYFDTLYPDYPRFTGLNASLTKDNMEAACTNALKRLAGYLSNEGNAVLAGLGLLKGNQVDISDSPYARWIQDVIDAAPKGKVITRDDLIQDIVPAYGIARSRRFGLEPALLVVVIAAVIYAKGNVKLVYPKVSIDATNIKDLYGEVPVGEWGDFKHMERTRVPSPEVIKAVLEGLGLPPGLYAQDDVKAVKEIVAATHTLIDQLVTVGTTVAGGIACGSIVINSTDDLGETGKRVDSLKKFLEKLVNYDTPAKLTHLDAEREAIAKLFSVREDVQRVLRVSGAARDLGALVNYLDAARSTDAAWHSAWDEQKGQLKAVLAAGDNAGTARLKQDLLALKQQYIEGYLKLHTKARLGAVGDKRKKKLLDSDTMSWLKALKTVPMLPKQQYDALVDGLGHLVTCSQLEAHEMESSPLCPHCQYDPQSEGGVMASLDDLEEMAESLLADWLAGVRSQLADPVVLDHIGLLEPKQQRVLKEFAKDGKRPADASTFVPAVLLALQDMTKIVITRAELLEKVGKNQALTVDEFNRGVQELLEEKLAGHDRSRVRIVIE